MEIAISTRHGDLNDEAEGYIRRKLPKLEHLFGRLTSIRVMVDYQASGPEVELLVEAEHKHDFVAREREESVTGAFDRALEKMEGQLRRYKEKLQDHHR